MAGDTRALQGVGKLENPVGWLAQATLGLTGRQPDPAIFYRARVLLLYASILFLLAVGWGGMHLVTGSAELGVLFLLCAAGVVAILVQLRRDHGVSKAAHLVLSAGLFATSLATGLSGGLRDTNVAPFFMLIIASVFLLGRAGLPWAAGSILAPIAFQIAHWSGVTFPDTIDTSGAALDRFLTWFSAAMVVFLFAWAYESTRVLTIARLERANRALQESEAKYRLVVSHANDAIILVQEGRIAFHNERVLEMTHCTAEEVAGRSYLDFVYPSDRSAATQRHIEQLAGKEYERAYRARLIDKYGRVIFAKISSLGLLWEGKPATLHFIDDITARRQTEHALRRTEVSLRHAQRMEAIGRLAGGVAHDFNNYLVTILGAADSLDAQLKEGQPVGPELDDIRQAAGLAGTLTRQLLAFGRKQQLHPVVVQLNRVVDEMSSMIQRVVGEQVEVVTVLDPELGRVRLDPGQIEQVIMNLAANAKDSMPDGGRLTITTENVSFDEPTPDQESRDGHFVCLTVTDTGIGMDKETIEHVFEPFFTTKPSGSGLGLPVVYGIVSQHDGWIRVDSELERGSTFRVYWPVFEDAQARSEPPVDSGPRGLGRRVLVVEDVPSIRRYTANVLRKHDYVVFEANDAEEAKRVYDAEGGRLDLLLTDVVLEDVSGVVLAQSLREQDSSLRVLLASGYVDGDLGRFGEAGTQLPFIPKPYNPQQLLEAVDAVLRG